MSDADRLVANLRHVPVRLPKEVEVRRLCRSLSDLLLEEPNLLSLQSPQIVCGDIHGQFQDLLHLLDLGGSIDSGHRYLFLGDLVDRGKNSLETFLLLAALKVQHPGKVSLLRGNHECRRATRSYGFYAECLAQYGSANVWKMCCRVFDLLPLAAIIDGNIFCVHGGLSPEIKQLDKFQKLDRCHEIPESGCIADLLWSDPQEAPGWTASPRGHGHLFGGDVVEEFNRRNGISLICRAHQLVMDGYRWHFGQKLVTIWSAPNYCYRCGNKAAILHVNSGGDYDFQVFEAQALHTRPQPKRLKKRCRQFFL
ncbi:serine/threonine-protein phosphatase 4 catalytic subunit [Drosophila ficusphila]|uniref:serine/threonine-protein phosphatase 4 catalytic subunit n=1 Tax=Drosophila ficusphila TaxID=30025 RepID=UPI0007E7D85B|nr:serine/threonine-protein phosphatase 4 catalytic subunit [Drosophila ficusphila]XP_017059427.1 serine/threonine-protein phosphatase 4 catalytic subunit [Drosophila ficusphila]